MANLAVELLMYRFSRASIQPEHFECDDRVAAALPVGQFFHSFKIRSGPHNLAEAGLAVTEE